MGCSSVSHRPVSVLSSDDWQPAGDSFSTAARVSSSEGGDLRSCMIAAINLQTQQQRCHTAVQPRAMVADQQNARPKTMIMSLAGCMAGNLAAKPTAASHAGRVSATLSAQQKNHSHNTQQAARARHVVSALPLNARGTGEAGIPYIAHSALNDCYMDRTWTSASSPRGDEIEASRSGERSCHANAQSAVKQGGARGNGLAAARCECDGLDELLMTDDPEVNIFFEGLTGEYEQWCTDNVTMQADI